MSRVPAGALPLEGGAFAASVWSSSRAARFHPLHPAKRLTSSLFSCSGEETKTKKKSSKYVRTARNAVASLQRLSPIPAAQWELKPPLWWHRSSGPRRALWQRSGLFFSLDATKAANQIVSFPLSAARFISTNMMLQLKAPLLWRH